jgi:integrase
MTVVQFRKPAQDERDPEIIKLQKQLAEAQRQLIESQQQVNKMLAEQNKPKKKKKKEHIIREFTSTGHRVPSPMEPLNHEDILKLIEYFPVKRLKRQKESILLRNKMLVIVGCSFGIRISDLLNLKIGDVYDKATKQCKKVIKVWEQKTTKPNDINITDAVKQVVLEYIRSLDEVDPNAYLFYSRRANDQGEHKLNPSSAWGIMTKACKECGIEGLHGTHGFRKTLINGIIEVNKDNSNGMNIAQYVANHSDQRTTFNYTTRLKQEAFRSRAELDKYFKPIENEDN